MVSGAIGDQLSIALATERATPGQRQFAIAIALVALALFIGIAPFVRTPLPRMPAFIPAYQMALFFVDLITAALLVDQFLRLRSAALLVLASAYLFDSLIIVIHTLSFPGAFSPTGLLGSGPQTTAWLYVFWHGGFSLFVIGYALVRRRESEPLPWISAHPGRAVVASFAAVACLVAALAVLTTRGHDLLPVVMQGGDYSMLVTKGFSPAIWLLTLIAFASLWQRGIRVMDLWLMLVMWVWFFDIALSAVLGASRFDLGFYVGRMFGLIAASVLLVALFVEMARMYAGAVRAVAAARLELAGSARPAAVPVTQPVRSPSRPVDTASFIRAQNIERYRRLLDSETLSETEQRTIRQLLAAEELREAG